MRRFSLLLVLIILAGAGCARNIGAKRLPVDRTAYVEALGNSWKEQLLYNIVKMRYGDAPTFLEVTSITQGYQLQATVGGTYTYATGDIAAPGTSTTYAAPTQSTATTANTFTGTPPQLESSVVTTTNQVPTGGKFFPTTVANSKGLMGTFFNIPKHTIAPTFSGQYQSTPSVVYAPVSGEVVKNLLLQPIPLDDFCRALQTGGDPSFILPYCVQSINNKENDPVKTQDIGELAKIWKDLKDRNALHIIFHAVEEEAVAPLTQEPGKPAPPKNQWDEFAGNLVKFTNTLVKKQDEAAKKEAEPAQAFFVKLEGEQEPALVNRFKEKLWGQDSIPKEKEAIPKEKEAISEKNEFQIVNAHQPPKAKTPATDIKTPKENKPKHTISVRTRSVEEVLKLLSKFITVPDSHKEGTVVQEGLKGNNWFEGIHRFKVSSTKDTPQVPDILHDTRNAFATVKYRGYWFWIGQDDLHSKEILSKMVAIFTMLPTGQKDTPVLTLPVK